MVLAPWGLPCGTRTGAVLRLIRWLDTYRFLLAEDDSSKLARGEKTADAMQSSGSAGKLDLHVGELDTPLVGFCFTYSSILPNPPSSRLEHAAAECAHDAIETERTGGSRVQILQRGAVSPAPPRWRELSQSGHFALLGLAGWGKESRVMIGGLFR